MQFSDFDNSQSGIPKPSLNGGLYTGEKFNGPWGNVYVQPDIVYLTSMNLKSANPPQNALVQYGNVIRPGNNNPVLTNTHKYSNEHNVVCTGSFKGGDVVSYDPLFENEMLLQTKK
jgi:hypothetical protein